MQAFFIFEGFQIRSLSQVSSLKPRLPTLPKPRIGCCPVPRLKSSMDSKNLSKKQTLQVALTKTSWKTRRNKLAGVSKEISMSAVVQAVLSRLKAFFFVKTEKYVKRKKAEGVSWRSTSFRFTLDWRSQKWCLAASCGVLMHSLCCTRANLAASLESHEQIPHLVSSRSPFPTLSNPPKAPAACPQYVHGAAWKPLGTIEQFPTRFRAVAAPSVHPCEPQTSRFARSYGNQGSVPRIQRKQRWNKTLLPIPTVT